MKEKIEKILKICLLFLVLIIPFTYLSSVRADSGWDSGYSGGSSGGGGSSSGGGSSIGSSSSSRWSTGGSSRDRDSGYSSDESDAVFLVIFIIFLVIIVVGILGKDKNDNTYKINDNAQRYPDISENEIKTYLPDHTLGSLKHMAYQKFIEIQNAWMNFEYDRLRELCTDELYNTYKAQLEVLKMKDQKNIMTNFNLQEIRIIEIFATSEIISVGVYLRVSFYDYVINCKTNEEVQGTKDTMITNNYKMKYVVSRNRKVIDKCPNCGAPVDAVTSKECEYCGSTIVFDSKDFVLSKKTNEKTTKFGKGY